MGEAVTDAGTRVLNQYDAVALGAIVSAAQRNAPVARANDSGSVIFGTARSIGDAEGRFAADSDDVRDCYLRVTTNTGFEAFWLVSDLLAAYKESLFVLDYQP